jgi:hypothetical protein
MQEAGEQAEKAEFIICIDMPFAGSHALSSFFGLF